MTGDTAPGLAAGALSGSTRTRDARHDAPWPPARRTASSRARRSAPAVRRRAAACTPADSCSASSARLQAATICGSMPGAATSSGIGVHGVVATVRMPSSAAGSGRTRSSQKPSSATTSTSPVRSASSVRAGVPSGPALPRYSAGRRASRGAPERARRVEARLRIVGHPAEAMAEGLLQAGPSALRAHQELAAVARQPFVAPRRRHRRGDRLHAPDRTHERPAAHESAAQLGLAPQLRDRPRTAVRDEAHVDARVGEYALEQRAPRRGRHGAGVVHPQDVTRSVTAANVSGTAASARPRRAGLSAAARGRARCRLMLRPRCQNRIVSSSRSRPGLRPATICPSSACRLRLAEPVGVHVLRAARRTAVPCGTGPSRRPRSCP